MSANVIIRKREVKNKVWNVKKLRLCKVHTEEGVLSLPGRLA